MPSRLEEAIALSAAKHAGQTDKAGRPYILHCLRVMFLLVEHGDDAACIGVLHDVVEDCGVSIEEIRQRFGDTVAGGVDALTRREGETYDEFIARNARSAQAIYIRAKLADLADNGDPARAALLPQEKREALAAKYSGARQILEAALARLS